VRALSSGHAPTSAPGTPPPTNGGATNDSLLTRRTRSSMLRRMTALGQQQRFVPPRLSGRCRFSQETFARTWGKGRNAPKPVSRRNERNR